MIKCNVTVCGTIGRNASARTNKEGNSFLSFPLRVTIPDRDGQNEVIEISVSKDGSQEEASGYRNGSHVEITGTLFLKRRGDKLYFNLFADRIDPVASDTADFLKGDMAFRGKVGKNIEERNDRFFNDNGHINTHTNHSGGIQGGISNGQDIYFRVAFKSVATILMEQETVNMEGEDTILKARGRHDPCVLPRAVPIVESMAAMTLLDFLLMQKIRN